VWAEVKVGDEHLRLFAEDNAQGVQASVYNVNTKNWIAPSETVDDIEARQGKSSKRSPGLPEACHQFRIAAVGVEEIPRAVVLASRLLSAMLYGISLKDALSITGAH